MSVLHHQPDHLTSARDQTLSIGELAARAGVSTRTVRYYEEIGLLPAPPRTTGGTRRFPASLIADLEGVRYLKDLGLGLDEIAEVVRLARDGGWDAERGAGILHEKLGELQRQIRILRRLRIILTEATTDGEDGTILGRIGEASERDLELVGL